MPMPVYLSPEAKNILTLMYSEYCVRIENGENPTDAKAFGAGKQLKQAFNLDCTLMEISEWCKELHDSGLINAVFTYEEGLIGIYLFSKGIEYISDKRNGSKKNKKI